MRGYWVRQQCDICKKDICRFLCSWRDVKIPTMCNECWDDKYPQMVNSQ